MTTGTTELTAAEIVRLGEEIYYRDILPFIEPGNEGRVVAVDVHTGAYELAEDALTSASRLRARVPAAEVFVTRVGQRGLHHVRLV